MEGKPTPIGNGEIMRAEKIFNQIGEKSKEFKELFDRAASLNQERQCTLDEELAKPTEKMDMNLISLLQEDIRVTDGIINNLIDTTLEAFNLQDEARDRIMTIEKRIKEKGY